MIEWVATFWRWILVCPLYCHQYIRLTLRKVRNWEFLLPTPTITRNLGGEPDPRQLLRRRSSLVVADLPIPKLPLEMKSGGLHQPPPSVFEEPESSSLLDSFGF